MGLFNPPSTTLTTSSTVTPTTVEASAASTNLLAANSARKGVTISNLSTGNLYVDTAAVTTSSYLVKIPAGGYYEFPYNYTGAIYGVWDAANGNAYIREFS